MIQYLKNMAGYSHAQLKDKSFDEVQKLFEKHMKWINSFVPMEEDLPSEKVQMEESSEKKTEGNSRKKSISWKRAKDKQEQQSSKRQRVEDDKEEEELKKCFKLSKEEEIAINAIPLATKVLVVVKAKHGDNRPEEDFERVLWGNLRVMFEPDVESKVWRSLQGYKEEEKEEEKANDDEDVSSDQMVSTPPDYEITEEEENQEDDDDVMGGEQEDEEDEELYGDLNLNLDRRDAEMTDAQNNQETEEAHVTLTTKPPVVQQQSSYVSSDLVSKFNVSVFATTEIPSSDTTIPQPPIPIIQPQQQTHDSITITTLLEIPNFASLFGFEQRVSSLETELSELKQTNQFAKALSFIPCIVDNYLASKMKDAVNVAVQLKSNKLREEAQVENDEFLKQIDSNIRAIIKDQVKAQIFKIMPKVEKYVTDSLGAEVLARSSNQPQTSYAAAASLSEFELKKIIIDKCKENKSMNISNIQKHLCNTLIESYSSDKDLFTSYGDVVTLKRGRDDQDKDEEPSAGSNRGTNQRRSGKEEPSKEATQKESKSTSSSKGASRSQPKSSGKSAQAKEHGPRVDDLEEPLRQEFNTGNDDISYTIEDRPPQSWMTQFAQASGIQSSFNGFLATPIDFFAFIMNWLKSNNLTQDVLTGQTYDLMKGTCKSVVELEYHLEEVFKATNDQLDWHNPEGRPYLHDLSKPLPLIQNARGRQVIPFDHFINNDLEYLKGGSSSKKYTTSITKTKAADYGHVQWIEDKVP
ncbi:hypothetical protein Tco_1419271, partial [Tanacetum coccineum]